MPNGSTPGAGLERSRQLYERARHYSPGGVQGAGRDYGPFPVYFKEARGARVRDIDGNEYIDYVGSFGPAALGMAEPRVVQAVTDAIAASGIIVALPNEGEVALAETFTQIIPYAEKTTFHGGGGSDALYNALRIARAYTGRMKFVKFEGGYHGWHNELAISVKPSPAAAGPREAPNPVPMSGGSMPEHLENCFIAHVNDTAFIQRLVERHSSELAAIFIEPVIHSCGCLLVKPEFLRLLRELCDAHGIVLVFDEIITGFRHGLQGAGAQLGVHPDIAAFGKAMANGFVIAALTGRNELMSLMAPEGPVLFSGTFNAHSLSVAAARRTIEIMQNEPVHERLFALGDRLRAGINAALERYGVPGVCINYGSVWCLYFSTSKVEDYRDIIDTAWRKDNPVDVAYRQHLMEHGIFLYPYFVNRGFISYAHSDADIDLTIEVTDKFIRDHARQLS